MSKVCSVLMVLVTHTFFVGEYASFTIWLQMIKTKLNIKQFTEIPSIHLSFIQAIYVSKSNKLVATLRSLRHIYPLLQKACTLFGLMFGTFSAALALGIS